MIKVGDNMTSIKLFVMDVDGTLTDGKIHIGENGEVFKSFSVKDGYGINDILKKEGIVPVILTARKSNIVENRAKELNIAEIHQGCTDKKTEMIEIAKKYGIFPDDNGVLREVAYVGDDVPDLRCMEVCGLRGCPKNASDEIKAICEFISSKNGGDGAVREYIEWIAKKRKR